MALINKLYNSVRKTGLTTAALALTGLAALVTPSYSAEPVERQVQNQAQNKYNFEEFQKAYGEKSWSELGNSRKKVTEKWQELSKDYKKALIEIYSDPEDFYKNHLTEEQRKEFEEFSEKELTTGKNNSPGLLSYIVSTMGKGLWKGFLEEKYPWIVNSDNLSQKEKLAIYMDLRLEESFNSQEEKAMPKWYSEMTPEEIRESEKYWKSLSPTEKKRMTQVFKDPKEYIKKYLDRKEQEDFQDYFFSPDIANMSEEERATLDKYQSIFPWKQDIRKLCNPKITDDYTNAKRLIEYLESEDSEKEGNFRRGNTKK